MPFLKIIEPGFLTTIQDRGRFHYQKWGIPAAGAMDEYALRTGNILVGNHEDEGCLEITLLGPVIEFLETGLVALTGADLDAKLNEKYSCPPWKSFWVKRGDTLRFTGIRSGCRSYLAVAGGFKIPEVMGSKSTYLRGKMGGMDGRALRMGDTLELNSNTKKELTARLIPQEYRYKQLNPQIVRVVLGPQYDAFTQEGIKTFLQSEYAVTNESDRMGCRLEGPKIKHKNKADIISDGIAMGSIQVPGKGTPIVMMADRQTTGGYAKIATVITPDLWKLAQAKPGEGIKFTSVTLEQAHKAYREYEKRIKELPRNLIEVNGRHKRLMLVKVAGREYRVEVEEI